MKKTKKPMTVKVKVEQPVSVAGVLSDAIVSYSAKTLVKQIFLNCLDDSSISTSPLLGIIISKKETDKLIENAEAAQAIYYLIKHWDELKEKGKKELAESMGKYT